MAKKKAKTPSNNIAQNKKARHEFVLDKKFEAGIELQGWEIKSIRQGKVNMTDAYVFVKQGEVFLSNTQIQPLNQASSHVLCEPNRVRKLLLNKREISELIGSVERKGYTLVPTSMYWVRNWVKVSFALAKGKLAHDKRTDIKDRDWSRQKERIMKHSSK
ncbi:MAG: SsrA-binding protein SmpB [Gammaproteobacteria bacterium]|nr:SsrA-binding protein SmpB [Gammaproteobacteria bacterium]